MEAHSRVDANQGARPQERKKKVPKGLKEGGLNDSHTGDDRTGELFLLLFFKMKLLQKPSRRPLLERWVALPQSYSGQICYI